MKLFWRFYSTACLTGTFFFHVLLFLMGRWIFHSIILFFFFFCVQKPWRLSSILFVVDVVQHGTVGWNLLFLWRLLFKLPLRTMLRPLLRSFLAENWWSLKTLLFKKLCCWFCGHQSMYPHKLRVCSRILIPTALYQFWFPLQWDDDVLLFHAYPENVTISGVP